MLSKNQFFVLLTLLALPVFLINLDLRSFITDEPTRAVVAEEMIHSGNYIVPTINGNHYYNKPPLYNWILTLLHQEGTANEFLYRLPTVLSIFLFGYTLFFFIKREYSETVGLWVSLAFMTANRILFYDSLLGLIDMFFSWIILLQFICIYYAVKRRSWWSLFILSYSLTAVGFMLKGLPSLVFAGLSIFFYLLWTRNGKKLFHPAHVVGVSVLFGLLGLYYYYYHQSDVQKVSLYFHLPPILLLYSIN
jgi:4-amino-4-deoxy-L-arabinose transferase-like glycosyltransferase